MAVIFRRGVKVVSGLGLIGLGFLVIGFRPLGYELGDYSIGVMVCVIGLYLLT